MKKRPPTCPWFRSWKRTVPSVSGRTTTARAGTRARWQLLHSVTSALLPSRHSSWKSRERSRWAQGERLLPETSQDVLKEQASGGADAPASKPHLHMRSRTPISWASLNYSWLHSISCAPLWSCSPITSVRLHWAVLGSAAVSRASLVVGHVQLFFGFFSPGSDILKQCYTQGSFHIVPDKAG